MNIQELISRGANTAIILNSEDLRMIIAQTVEETRKETLKEAANKDDEVYYSIAEVCEILSKNPATLWRWEKSGYLIPTTRVGKNPRYSKSDIDKLLGKKGGK